MDHQQAEPDWLAARLAPSFLGLASGPSLPSFFAMYNPQSIASCFPHLLLINPRLSTWLVATILVLLQFLKSHLAYFLLSMISPCLASGIPALLAYQTALHA